MVHGADVASKEIVICNGKRSFSVKNTKAGIERFLKGIEPSGIIALEPTSHYSDLLALLAHEAGHTVYMVQPSWIRSHRKARRQRSKTDKVDAVEIRDYAIQEQEKLHAWRPLSQALGELRNLVRQRRGIVGDLARMRQRYRDLQMAPELIQVTTSGALRVKKDLDRKIKKALKAIPEAKVIMQIPGVGVQIAATVIVTLQHIPFATSDAFVAFAGLDPVASDSGQKSGRRKISKQGDVALRTAFFMAAMTATRHKVWKDRYQSLKAKGLKPKQALIALAKKIATVTFHLHRKQIDFDPQKVGLTA